MKLFSDAYTGMLAALAAKDFFSDKGWEGVMDGLRTLVQPGGFAKGKGGSVDDLRQRVVAESKGGEECGGFIVGAGKWDTNGAVCDAATAQKLGALKLLRHTCSVTNWGARTRCGSCPRPRLENEEPGSPAVSVNGGAGRQCAR
jgi:hypothetical protein